MCTWLAADLTTQLVQPIIELNYGSTDEMPQIVPDSSVPLSQLEQAQTAQIWLQFFAMQPHDATEISGLPLQEKAQPTGMTVVKNGGNGNGKTNGDGNGNGNREQSLQAMLRAIESRDAGANETLSRVVTQQYAERMTAANQPLLNRLKTLDAIHDDNQWMMELRVILAEFPTLAQKCLAGLQPAANTLAQGMSAALVNGMAETINQRR
jgi:hypothetical protein